MGQVCANRGAAAIDRITLVDVVQYGSVRPLDELAADLRDGRYRPPPARRVFIPKLGSQERRPPSIPAIRDRIVQAATTVIEPIFEARSSPAPSAIAPRRTATMPCRYSSTSPSGADARSSLDRHVEIGAAEGVEACDLPSVTRRSDASRETAWETCEAAG